MQHYKTITGCSGETGSERRNRSSRNAGKSSYRACKPRVPASVLHSFSDVTLICDRAEPETEWK